MRATKYEASMHTPFTVMHVCRTTFTKVDSTHSSLMLDFELYLYSSLANGYSVHTSTSLSLWFMSVHACPYQQACVLTTAGLRNVHLTHRTTHSQQLEAVRLEAVGLEVARLLLQTRRFVSATTSQ
jgi:hypothetical protein